MSETDETLREFLVESFENLEQLDRELLLLEAEPSNLETINKIFRIIHTVKGTCGFFDLKKLEKVSHVGENLLDSMRSEQIKVTAEMITSLLKLSDTLRELLANIELRGSEGDGDYSVLIAKLSSFVETRGDTEVLQPKAELMSPHESIIFLTETVEEPGVAEKPVVNEPVAIEMSKIEDELERLFAAAQAEREKELEEQVAAEEATPAAGEDASVSVSTEAESKPVSSAVQDAKPERAQEIKKSELSETSLRVDVSILDKLMNLVGELVLARNQILQFTKRQSDGEFASTSQRLNLITSELQDGVMRTRMQPISTVWNKLPRIVRDVAHSCGKQVKLEMYGKETELDKTIIEAIKDPLTHVIRNSVDHGIESPERRVAGGKSAEGTLMMRAFHEGGQVIIETSDDGAGLNTERIRAKALEKGLVSSDRAPQMSEAEINRLIFLPGFSTADQVTNLSGRGVGMDVVRSNIERIGGAVDVSSTPGKGAKFTIKIPLTLAIIPALIVTTNENRYAIPQVNLLELVRIEGDDTKNAIERIQGADFYRLRGRILPLLYLDEQLALHRGDGLKNYQKDGIINLVVVRADNHQFGLVVSAIHDTEEIVVKPLGRLLKGISAFAGATIMGDGQVALILDIVGLARNVQIAKKETTVRNQEKSSEAVKNQNKRKMFVFEVGDNQRVAVPLDQVYRLEEFASDKLERAGDNLVVQYRDVIMPLIDLRRDPSVQREAGGNLRAFVYDNGKGFVGFIVEQIVDIVEQSVKVESPFHRKELIGSAVIQGKVTDLIDLQVVLNSTDLSTAAHDAERGAC